MRHIEQQSQETIAELEAELPELRERMERTRGSVFFEDVAFEIGRRERGIASIRRALRRLE